MKLGSKTLILVFASSLLAFSAAAAPVTFWFSGVVDYMVSPSNAHPAGLMEGTSFSGRVTYDPALVTYTNLATFPSGKMLNNYFNTTAGFSMLVQIGGHTITSTTNSDGFDCGYAGVRDQHNNADSLDLDTAHADLILNGRSTRAQNLVSTLSLYLLDQTMSAYGSAVLPTQPPTLDQFPSTRRFGWVSTLDDGNNTLAYLIAGEITTLTTNELVALNFRRTGDNTAQLRWPTAVSGYTLQSTTNLSNPDWQTVTNPVVVADPERTVTVPTIGGNRVFRLKK